MPAQVRGMLFVNVTLAAVLDGFTYAAVACQQLWHLTV